MPIKAHIGAFRNVPAAFGGHAAKTRELQELFSLGWWWQVYVVRIKEGQNMGGGGHNTNEANVSLFVS